MCLRVLFRSAAGPQHGEIWGPYSIWKYTGSLLAPGRRTLNPSPVVRVCPSMYRIEPLFQRQNPGFARSEIIWYQKDRNLSTKLTPTLYYLPMSSKASVIVGHKTQRETFSTVKGLVEERILVILQVFLNEVHEVSLRRDLDL